MPYRYTPTALSPRHPEVGMGFGGSVPPPPGAPIPWPPPPARHDDRRSHRGLVVAGVLAACLSVLVAGIVGVYVGSLTATKDQQAVQAAPASPTSAPPTAEQVRASTVDLCTRFAAGYRAMPSPQNRGFDVVPTANYIADALRDNPIADPSIRNAITKSLEFLRDQAAALSREPSAGAIHIPQDWKAAPANTADQRSWDLCRAYEG